jgi:hypothetical protein
MDRVKTGIQTTLAKSVLLDATAELTFLTYGREPGQSASAGEKCISSSAGTTSGTRRCDIDLALNLSGEYQVLRWLGVTVDLGYRQKFTDYVYSFMVANAADPTMMMTLNDPAKYSVFNAWIGLRAFF